MREVLEIVGVRTRSQEAMAEFDLRMKKSNSDLPGKPQAKVKTEMQLLSSGTHNGQISKPTMPYPPVSRSAINHNCQRQRLG